MTTYRTFAQLSAAIWATDYYAAETALELYLVALGVPEEWLDQALAEDRGDETETIHRVHLDLVAELDAPTARAAEAILRDRLLCCGVPLDCVLTGPAELFDEEPDATCWTCRGTGEGIAGPVRCSACRGRGYELPEREPAAWREAS